MAVRPFAGYKGTWIMGTMNGPGAFSWVDGTSYKGQYRSGARPFQGPGARERGPAEVTRDWPGQRGGLVRQIFRTNF